MILEHGPESYDIHRDGIRALGQLASRVHLDNEKRKNIRATVELNSVIKKKNSARTGGTEFSIHLDRDSGGPSECSIMERSRKNHKTSFSREKIKVAREWFIPFLERAPSAVGIASTEALGAG